MSDSHPEVSPSAPTIPLWLVLLVGILVACFSAVVLYAVLVDSVDPTGVVDRAILLPVWFAIGIAFLGYGLFSIYVGLDSLRD